MNGKRFAARRLVRLLVLLALSLGCTHVSTIVGANDAEPEAQPAIDADTPVDSGITVLATGQLSPEQIVVDSNNVYWTNFGSSQSANGSVVKCAIDGCNGVPTTIAAAQGSPIGIAIDSTSVYWTNANASTVASCAIDGCTEPNVIASSPDAVDPLGITVDAAHVYWTSLGGGTVMQCPLAGCAGNAVTLAQAQSGPASVAVNATTLFWTDQGGSVMKVDFAGVPWGDAGNQLIPEPLATNLATPEFIVVDANNIYWGGAVLMQMPLDGSSAPITIDGSPASGLAVDATHIYWVSYEEGLVLRCAIGGGNRSVLASGQHNPFGIAIDDASVYWTNAGDGTVMKLPK